MDNNKNDLGEETHSDKINLNSSSNDSSINNLNNNENINTDTTTINNNINNTSQNTISNNITQPLPATTTTEDLSNFNKNDTIDINNRNILFNSKHTLNNEDNSMTATATQANHVPYIDNNPYQYDSQHHSNLLHRTQPQTANNNLMHQHAYNNNNNNNNTSMHYPQQASQHRSSYNTMPNSDMMSLPPELQLKQDKDSIYGWVFWN